MISKLGNNVVGASQLSEPEPAKQEQSVVKENVNTTPAPTPRVQANEARFAFSLHGNMMRSSLHSVLGTQPKAPDPNVRASEFLPSTKTQDVATEGAAGGSGLRSISDDTVLLRGSHGSQVATVQTELNKWREQHGLPPISVTSDYSAETEAAVKEFQEANGLKPDGKFGLLTRDRMALENDPKFQGLPDQVKDRTRALMEKWAGPPAVDPGYDSRCRSELMNMVTKDLFGDTKSSDAQLRVIDFFDKIHLPGGATGRAIHYLKDQVQLENDPIFQGLGDGIQRDVQEKLGSYFSGTATPTGNGRFAIDALPGNAMDGLVFLATNPKFAVLSDAHQAELLYAYNSDPRWDNQVQLSQVISTTGFSNADDAQKSRLIALARNHSKNQSDITQLSLLLESPAYNGMTPEQQKQALELYEVMHPSLDPEIVK